MPKTFIHLLAVATLIFGAGSSHAALMTFHTAGKINSGYDYSDRFGYGTDLQGLQFTQSITFETDGLAPHIAGMGYDGRMSSGRTVTGTARIGEVSISWASSDAEVILSFWNLVTLGLPYGPDQVYAAISGRDVRSADFIQAGSTVHSTSVAFLDNLDFSKERMFHLPMDGVTSHSYFYAGDTGFTGFPTSASWQVAREVPEPATLPIVLLGLGLIGLAGRTKIASSLASRQN